MHISHVNFQFASSGHVEMRSDELKLLFRTMQEISLLSKLRHENIVQYIGTETVLAAQTFLQLLLVLNAMACMNGISLVWICYSHGSDCVINWLSN